MKSFRTIVILTFVVSTYLILTQSATAQEHIIKLDSTVFDATYNSVTGEVATVDPVNNEVCLFKPAFFSGDATALSSSLKVGQLPVSITFKQYKEKSFYIVICRNSTYAYILDAVKFQVTKKIDIGTIGARNVYTSKDKDDPYVYYNHGRGNGSTLGVLNLSKMNFLKKVPGTNDSMDAEISANGEFIYLRGPYSSSGFESYKKQSIENGWPVFKQYYRERTSKGKYLSGPISMYTICGGKNVYTIGLKNKLGTLMESAVGYFRKFPLIIGSTRVSPLFSSSSLKRSSEFLSLYSHNSLDKLDSIKIPHEFFVSSPLKLSKIAESSHSEFKKIRWNINFIADDKAARIICFNKNKVIVVPLTSFKNYSEEPWLLIEINKMTFEPGIKQTTKIIPFDSSTTSKLVDGPIGMKLKKGILTWTPDVDKIGTYKAAIETSIGEKTKRQVFNFKVSRKSIELPFKPNGIEFSKDEKVFIIWISKKIQRRGGTTTPQIQEVALIDAETGKTIVRKKMLNQIAQVLIDENGVYMVPVGLSRVFCLSLTDLSRKKDLLGDGSRTIEISTMGPARLAMLCSGQSGKLNLLKIYDTKTFKQIASIEDSSLSLPNKDNSLDPGKWHWLSGNYFLDNDGEILGLSIHNQKRRRRSSNYKYPKIEGGWGYTFSSGKLTQRSRQLNIPLASLKDGGFLKEAPCFAYLSEHAGVGTVSFLNLDSSETIKETVIYRNETIRNNRSQRIRFLKNKVAIIDGQKLYYYEVPAEVIKKSKMPHLIYPKVNKVPLIKWNESVEINIKSNSIVMEFVPESNLAGMNVNGKTGLITLDGRLYNKNIPKISAAQLTNNIKEYKLIFGSTPKGIPYKASISIKAMDEEQRIATCNFSAFFIIPIKNATIQPESIVTKVKTTNNSDIKSLEKRIKKLEMEIELLKRLILQKPH